MDVLRWQGRKRGLLEIGYHLIVDRDGCVHRLRDVRCMGSHTPGYNHISIGLCLIGGRNAAGEPEDNFTALQKDTLVLLGASFLAEWVGGRIAGHHELRGYSSKEGYRCPALDDLDAIRREARVMAPMAADSGRLLSKITAGTHR